MAAQANTPKVLDVGQCDFDHGNISRILSGRFGAAVERCHGSEEALRAVAQGDYDLVLVNRIFDRGGEEGLKLIARLHSSETAGERRPPVMLVSNFADAQEQAVKAGAVKGFGKAVLESEGTMRLLEEFLGASRQPRQAKSG